MPAEHMLGPNIEIGFVDKRKAGGGKAGGDGFSHILSRYILVTATGGTTTTATFAAATVGTETATSNIVRLGDNFRIFTAAGVPVEETVFSVTAATGTSLTFTPAAQANVANTNILRLVGLDSYEDTESLDSALTKLASGTYTAAVLRQMNVNDKVFAMRHLTDPAQAAGQL